KELNKKNKNEAELMMNAFKKATFDYRQNKITSDAIFFNTAFLINSGREKEIDNIMSDIGEEYKDRIDFSYTGPMPIFNFIDLKIFPEKWETLG
ncbi:MAG: tRNA A37 methylthiotransferase MiaB, partial [Psychroserpens sp.]